MEWPCLVSVSKCAGRLPGTVFDPGSFYFKTEHILIPVSDLYARFLVPVSDPDCVPTARYCFLSEVTARLPALLRVIRVDFENAIAQSVKLGRDLLFTQ
jgi:hypothetical protein